MGLSKRLQEGLPGPLRPSGSQTRPKGLVGARKPSKKGPFFQKPPMLSKASGAFRGCKGTSTTWFAGFKPNRFKQHHRTLNKRDGYHRQAGRPALGFASPTRRLRTSDRGFGAHQAWRTGKRQSVSHNPWLSSPTPPLTRADDFNRTASQSLEVFKKALTCNKSSKASPRPSHQSLHSSAKRNAAGFPLLRTLAAPLAGFRS